MGVRRWWLLILLAAGSLSIPFAESESGGKYAEEDSPTAYEFSESVQMPPQMEHMKFFRSLLGSEAGVKGPGSS